MSDLSTRVRLRREQLGLSQEELARRMGADEVIVAGEEDAVARVRSYGDGFGAERPPTSVSTRHMRQLAATASLSW